MKNNILTIILSLLKVKYTEAYADRLYRNNPDRNSFYGLAYMLSVYGITCKGYKIEDKNPADMDVPFIAQLDSDFVAVSELNENSVTCHSVKGRCSISSDAFKEKWTGNLLAIHENRKAGEPDYDSHHKNEVIEKSKKYLFVASSIFVLAGLVMSQRASFNGAFCLYALLCLSGLGLSMMLLEKQLYSKSIVGDKICTIFGKGGCDDVGRSYAYHGVAGISLSEMGVGYFLANIIALAISGDYIYTFGIIDLMLLPFTFWSLWYQRFKVGSWCVLCVFVQVVIWGLCVVSGFSYGIVLRQFDVFIVPVCFVLIYIVHRLSSAYMIIHEQEKIVADRQAIICKPAVFSAMLRMQPHCEVTCGDSSIVLGNAESNRCITVISNPFCIPCTKAHKTVEKILMNNPDIAVRYIFSAHKPELREAAVYLIASYFKKGPSAIEEWFNLKIDERKSLIRTSGEGGENAQAIEELSHHRAFVEKYRIRWTPTVLIDGYMKPTSYTIEDVEYILFEQ